MNSAPAGLLAYLGMSRHRGGRVLHEGREAILQMFVKRAAADAGARIEAPRILRRKKGSEVWYAGFVLAREGS